MSCVLLDTSREKTARKNVIYPERTLFSDDASTEYKSYEHCNNPGIIPLSSVDCNPSFVFDTIPITA